MIDGINVDEVAFAIDTGRCLGGHQPNGEEIASDGFCYGCHNARDRELDEFDREPEGPEIE